MRGRTVFAARLRNWLHAEGRGGLYALHWPRGRSSRGWVRDKPVPQCRQPQRDGRCQHQPRLVFGRWRRLPVLPQYRPAVGRTHDGRQRICRLRLQADMERCDGRRLPARNHQVGTRGGWPLGRQHTARRHELLAHGRGLHRHQLVLCPWPTQHGTQLAFVLPNHRRGLHAAGRIPTRAARLATNTIQLPCKAHARTRFAG